MAKSIDFLNFEFTQVQKGQKFDTGSITPKTTTRKLVLDEVKLSEHAEKFTKLYEPVIKQKAVENIEKLNNSVKQNQEKLEPLEKLIKLEVNQSESHKTYTKNLTFAKDEIKSGEENIKLIENSKLIGIKEFKGFGFKTIYQENIHDAKEVKADTPAVLRYGLDTENQALNSIIGNYVEKGVLHPYEEALFIEALNYLKEVESAESYMKTEGKGYYPNNVVLVDIFDRSSGFINKGYSQTHTIALWKKKADEIILIDPSKISYSDHICVNLGKLLNIKVNSCNVPEGVIYGSMGKETGYSEYNIVSPKPRDCIDIAVKVAFELNEQQVLHNSLEDALNNTMKQISNQKVLAPHMNLVKDIFVRTLQSSNKYAREIALYTLSQGLYIEAKKNK
jgi:hypothetical protein